MKTPIDIWNDPLAARFSEAVFLMQSTAQLQRFFCDVMTKKEIGELSARFEAARLLEEKVPYIEIATRTKLSSRTIARISDWLKNGTGGYKLALAHHRHIPPAPAE